MRDARDRPSGGTPHASSRGRKERSRRLGEHGLHRLLARLQRLHAAEAHLVRLGDPLLHLDLLLLPLVVAADLLLLVLDGAELLDVVLLVRLQLGLQLSL